MSLVSRTRRRRLRRPCPERFVASGGASRPRRSGPHPGEAFMTQVTSRPRLSPRVRGLLGGVAAIGLIAGAVGPALADETCQSPYMAKITGEEDYVYVWTLGVEGMGDGSDKLVTVDVRKGSPTFGKAIKSVSVGGRPEAHHGGVPPVP